MYFWSFFMEKKISHKNHTASTIWNMLHSAKVNHEQHHITNNHHMSISLAQNDEND